MGKKTPTSYEEVLDVAKAIRDKGILKYPFAMLTKSDWNLGEEFVNMYLGHGGEFFKPASAQPAINNKKGEATLKMLKQLTEYSDPNFLAFNTAAVLPLWKSGELAMAVIWGSSVGDLIKDEGSNTKVAMNTMPLGAMSVAGNKVPASTLWWDGFTIAKNISDADAEASFKAMVNGISNKMVRANNDKAVWLMDAYKPSEAAKGALKVASSGAKPYPMLPYMSLLHASIQKELPDYLQGNETAKQTLADIEAAYIVAAKEQGFLN